MKELNLGLRYLLSRVPKYNYNSNFSLKKLKKFGARSLAYLTSRSHSHSDFFLLEYSVSYSRILKLHSYFMKKCSCRESNSRLLIESTVSYPLHHQDNDAGKCTFLLKNEAIAFYI